MDTMDIFDLAQMLAALVAVEARRGANEAAALGEAAVYKPDSFAAYDRLAAQALQHMEWWHNRG